MHALGRYQTMQPPWPLRVIAYVVSELLQKVFLPKEKNLLECWSAALRPLFPAPYPKTSHYVTVLHFAFALVGLSLMQKSEQYL